MHRHAARFAALALGAALLALAGCAETSPTTFYILSSLPPAADESPATARNKLSLGVGPVTLPAYLNRPQVVSLASANRLQLATRNPCCCPPGSSTHPGRTTHRTFYPRRRTPPAHGDVL